MADKLFNILGVNICDESSDLLIARVDNAIQSRRPIRLAFANAHTLNLAYQSQQYQEVLSCFHVVNDGVGVDIAKKYLYGEGFKENLNGTDFMPKLLASFSPDVRVFCLGAKDDVIEMAVQRLKNDNGNLNIVGYHHGFLSSSEDKEGLLKEIKEHQTDVLIVGMGNPAQEKWIFDNAGQAGVIVSVGVGAFFDFSSGLIKRAPRIIRQLRCEWAFRLILEPRRLFRRYIFGNALFLFRVFYQE